jgi:hypothetical protein
MEKNRLPSCKAAHEIADRLMDWHDQAKFSGREDRANLLLALAGYALGPPAPTIVETDFSDQWQMTIREFAAQIGGTNANERGDQC